MELQQNNWMCKEVSKDLEEVLLVDSGKCMTRVAAAANPNNLTLQMKSADVLMAQKKYKDALEVCIEIVAKDKHGIGVKAKEAMINIFTIMGPASELTHEFRRKLMFALY